MTSSSGYSELSAIYTANE